MFSYLLFVFNDMSAIYVFNKCRQRLGCEMPCKLSWTRKAKIIDDSRENTSRDERFVLLLWARLSGTKRDFGCAINHKTETDAFVLAGYTHSLVVSSLGGAFRPPAPAPASKPIENTIYTFSQIQIIIVAPFESGHLSHPPPPHGVLHFIALAPAVPSRRLHLFL